MSAPGGVAHRKGMGAAIDGGGDSKPDFAQLVDRSDEPADYGRWLRHWIWPALLATAGTFGMLAGGIDLWRAAALSGGVAVALWSIIVTMSVPELSWHEDVPGDIYRPSTTWEVAGLISSRESDDSFARYLRPRLWSLAETMLTRRGIEPDSDQAKGLIGAGNYAILTGGDTDPRRVTASVSVLCHTIARLAVEPISGSRPPIDSPALAGLAGARRARPSPSARRSEARAEAR